MTIRLRWGCLLFPFFLIGCQKPASTEEVATQEKLATLTISHQTAHLELKFPATLRGQQDVAIYPQVEGKIVRVLVEEGQTVCQGQALFVLDQVGYQSALATATANVQAAQARVDNARLNFESQQRLKERGVVSDFTIAQAHNDLKTAQAALAQAKAEQQNAHNNLSYTTIKSPSNGVVGTLPLKVGALVSATMTQPLTNISDNARMVAHFSMGEQQLSTLLRKYGSREKALEAFPEVAWKASDGTTYPLKGKIATISGLLDPQTGSVALRAVFDNPNRLLISGAMGTIVLPQIVEKAIVIPQTAVSEMQDKKVVYRIKEGKPVLTPIEVNPLHDGKNYIVTQGLKVGDVIKTTA